MTPNANVPSVQRIQSQNFRGNFPGGVVVKPGAEGFRVGCFAYGPDDSKIVWHFQPYDENHRRTGNITQITDDNELYR